MIKLVKTEVRQATTILKVILAAATMSRSNIILWLTAPDEKPATLRLSRTTLQNVERVLEEESGIYIAVVDDLPLSYRYRTRNLKGCATVLLQ